MLPGDGDQQAATRTEHASDRASQHAPERASERLVAGRYLLHDVLGSGGMGRVWRAHDQLLDRRVAAKELHIVSHGDEEQHRIRMRRAIREARAVARVPHPHVVGVHDLVESDDRLWIVMELVEGPSLAGRVAETGRLTPQHAATLGLQLLDALEAVHAAGTLHRDVKPANVLLRPNGSAVLTDFGIAALDDGEFLTTTGELIGSIEFMAPERVMGTETGPASDLWSLGATLATVCGGQSPFRRSAPTATLHAVAYEEPVLDERLGPLRPVVEALLLKSPDERLSAAGARSALGRVAAGEADAGPLPSPTARVFPPSSPATDANTVTSGRARHAPAGDTGATALHTMSLTPSHRQSSRPSGPKRLLWALAGTAVLVGGIGGGLFLTGVLPLKEDAVKEDPVKEDAVKEDPKTTTTSQVVRSTTGWQRVNGVTVQRGDQVTVRFASGEWTVDHRNMPMTGPAGYDANTDALLAGAMSCKIKPVAPFGTLLARLAGEQASPAQVVGRKLTFQAARNGALQLAINDAESCGHDNRGSLTVQVSVTHQP
ncbi:serine/threonine-protein kinase [Streptomyces acidicola]|uniref:non-specific serine/threonine protein kinase n=1 Tax=Streptomyces acidicola TaxID=2596892 RepID=A0A5N8X4N6_9ACTN|nr:serine/threonine-protein kinase [Streptomyces acidicola]MPY53878.1 serine/threonine protein kinase [Streptomyces acidicola]